MNKLEQQILESASTGDSDSSIGAQILEKGVGKLPGSPIDVEQNPVVNNSSPVPESVTSVLRELVSPEALEQIKKETKNYDRRGGVANPVELQQSIAQAVKEGVFVDTAATEKAQKEKDKLLIDLADLRVREKTLAQDVNASEGTKTLIQDSLRRIQKRIAEINNVLPNVDPLEDQEKVRRVIAEYEGVGHSTNEPTAEVSPEITLEPLTPLVDSEDAKLIESLENGGGYVRGGAEAEKTIEVLVHRDDEPKVSPISLVETEIIAPEATDIASTEQTEVTVSEKQPPQSAYESVMDRIWKENEAKREASGLKGAGENLTLEPRAEVPVVSEEIPSTPIGTEGPHLIAPEEQSIDPVLTQEEVDAQVAKNTEMYRRAMEKLTRLDNAVEARAEKAGMVDKVRKIGEMWNKVPKRYKYMLAGGAILSGVGAAAAGSVVAVGAVGALGTALRGLSGAGLFVTFETILKNAHEKKTGAERSKATETRHMLLASISAVAFAALLPKLISDYMGSEVIQTETPGDTAFEAPIDSIEKIEYIVGDGDTLWGGIEEKLGSNEVFAGMPVEQKTFVIDALKDKFAAMSPEELQAIGITSGNIDVIHPGDHIDLTSVLGGVQIEVEAMNFASTPSPEVTPLVEQPVAGASTVETSTTIPQEISPTDPSIVTASEKIVHDYVDEKFGTKGIFGIGAQNGTDSINWKDSEVGFANQTVEKIMSSHPSAFPEDGARHFGIEDYSATAEMQAGLTEVQNETGVAPLPNENAADYMKRAAATALSKSPTPLSDIKTYSI